MNGPKVNIAALVKSGYLLEYLRISHYFFVIPACPPKNTADSPALCGELLAGI